MCTTWALRAPLGPRDPTHPPTQPIPWRLLPRPRGTAWAPVVSGPMMPQVFGPGPKGLRSSPDGVPPKHLWRHTCCVPPDGQYQGGGVPGKTIMSGAAAVRWSSERALSLALVWGQARVFFRTMSLPATAAKPYRLDAPVFLLYGPLCGTTGMLPARHPSIRPHGVGGRFRLGQSGARRDRTQARTLGRWSH